MSPTLFQRRRGRHMQSHLCLCGLGSNTWASAWGSGMGASLARRGPGRVQDARQSRQGRASPGQCDNEVTSWAGAATRHCSRLAVVTATPAP